MRRETVAACALAAAVLAAPAAGAADAGVELPPGHPPTAAEDPHAGGAARGARAEAPQDGAMEDPTLPPGTIEVHVSDPDGGPMAKLHVTLGILYTSVEKGESRKRVVQTADEMGKARFESLETGSGVAYRVMVLDDGATFSVPPFQLPARTGMRAHLHVYPVERDVAETLIVSQAMIYAEVKDDRIQVQQAYKIYNFGRTAWVPDDVLVPLPPSFTAFTTQQGMTDVGADAVPGKGVKLRGTFGPGQHVVEVRWQLPYSGESDVEFEMGMPPHLAAARIIAPAARDMTLHAEGFPTPQPNTDGAGQRVLVTEKQLRREEPPMTRVRMAIRGLPTAGPGRVVATFLAAGGIAIGLVLGSRKPKESDPKPERAKLLADLEALERAHLAGDIGPKTYERARREIVDDLARTFAGTATPEAKRPKPRRA
jgi:hypothetical protein